MNQNLSRNSDQDTNQTSTTPSVFSVFKRKGNIIIIILGLLLLLSSSFAVYFYFQSQQKSILDIGTPIGYPVIPQSTATPTMLKSEAKTPVTSPAQYGFTNSIELSGIGIRALFPSNVTTSLQEKNFYVIKIKGTDSDAVSFALKDYDGLGRRAWFQKEFPWAKNYILEPFTGNSHSGYIAYAVKPEDIPGTSFYFSVINNKMLVVSGNNVISNNVNPTLGNTSVFFTTDIQKFKSFLSTIELTQVKPQQLEEFNSSNLYRSSSERKTIWEDKVLGLRIIAPLWTESRSTKENRDANGNFLYSDWVRTYSSASQRDYKNTEGIEKQIDVTGTFSSYVYVALLTSKYTTMTFGDVVNERLLPAGFCTTEWKQSKASCTSTDFCYTKEEVIQNLILKKETKIGPLQSQLRGMNQDFSNKNDCRAEDVWLIKGKNGQFILSNISPEDNITKVEGF